MGKISGTIRGFFYLYCLISCSFILCLIFLILFAPFKLISRRFERQLQEVTQWCWVYLLLGVTCSAADTQLVLYLPDNFGPKEVREVLKRLWRGFYFGNDIKLSGETGFKDAKRDLIISNHLIYMDWIYLWAIMARLRREGSVKIILKRSLLNVPVFGLCMKLLNFIFLHRNWEKDRRKFGYRLARLVYGNSPFSLVIFPEGTTLCADGMEKCKVFADKNSMPLPKYTLIPRVTGLQFALNTLGRDIGGIFDFTLGYEGTSPDQYPEDTFGLKSLFFDGKAPPLIHCHVRYHSIDTVPYEDSDKFAKWIYKIYNDKETMMEYLYREGKFPGTPSYPVNPAKPYSMIVITVASIFCTILMLLMSIIILLPLWNYIK